MQVLKRQILVALAIVSMIVVTGVPKVLYQKGAERKGFALLCGNGLVQLIMAEGSRKFAQLAEIRSGQETAEQEVESHKSSNDPHGTIEIRLRKASTSCRQIK